MIEEARGRIEHDESGTGTTLVLVPGSCSTDAAWRPVIANWNGEKRCVTTSLLGYGKTAERRTAGDTLRRQGRLADFELFCMIMRRGGCGQGIFELFISKYRKTPWTIT